MLASCFGRKMWLIASVTMVALHAASSRASETFPAQIQKDLGLKQKPDCILCHETDKGEKNTVTRPFGVSMRRIGNLAAGSLGSLDAALQKLEKEGTDSDQDGVPDIEELRMGRNPNVREIVVVQDAGSGSGDAAPPPVVVVEEPPPPGPPLMETGCACALARSHSGGPYPSAVGLGLVALSVARRRHRPRLESSRTARHSH